MMRYVLEREQLIAKPRSEVFEFFSNAANLGRITPEFLNFRILTPSPIAMKPAALIDYRIKLFGVPLRWRTEITVFEPERRFVDEQLRGPYRFWRHSHEFEDTPGGTRVIDRVEYELPFGPFGRLAHGAFVARTLERIFDYRQRRIAEHFSS